MSLRFDITDRVGQSIGYIILPRTSTIESLRNDINQIISGFFTTADAYFEGLDIAREDIFPANNILSDSLMQNGGYIVIMPSTYPVLQIPVNIFSPTSVNMEDIPVKLKESEKEKYKISRYGDIIAPTCTNCSICLEDFNNEDNIRVLCHYFHTECIDEWLSKSKYCPNCRNDLGEGEPVIDQTSETTEYHDDNNLIYSLFQLLGNIEADINNLSTDINNINNID